MNNVIIIKHKPHCTIHDEPGILNEIFDAYYCKPCNRWLEKGCGGSKIDYESSADKGCVFDCANRPQKPL